MTELARRWHLSECLGGGSDLLARSFRRIDEVEQQVQAWVALDRAARPGAPTAAAPLAGVPVAIKDIIDVAGFPTRCGTGQRHDAVAADADAGVVAALRAAGAVPIGKSVTTEYAYFAPGPTDNPAAPGHTPGGSSSGSAAAVAAGMVPLAIGSQTAGSLTRPASFCGVAGLVVTRGALPTTGVVGLSASCDSIGLLAAGAADLDLALAALGFGQATGEITSLMVWLPDSLGVDESMVDAVRTAAGLLRQGGIRVSGMGMAEQALAVRLIENQQRVMAYEAARLRAAEHAAGGLSEPLTDLLDAGAAMPDDVYSQATVRLDADAATVASWFDRHGAILAPAALGPAPAGHASTGSPVLSRGWQALGLPAVTVPGLRHHDGRPLGVQLIGAPHHERQLLQLAHRLELDVAAHQPPSLKEESSW